MIEIVIGKNDNEQRVDRFLKKYLNKAPKGYVYKMIRKKRIKLNGKNIKPENTIYDGDIIKFFLAQETIDKFRENIDEILQEVNLNIVYEDENIILVNKPIGLLSHSADGDYTEKNLVDQIVTYLYKKGEYSPRIEKTFRPSICNRLDKNTSGIVIGAKNYEALKEINEAFRNRKIDKYYKSIVKGELKKDLELKSYIEKDMNKNMMRVIDRNSQGSKEIITKVKKMCSNGKFTLVDIELVTGRTHQIRAHLSSIGYPIIGDRKYGDKDTNMFFREKYKLENQFLHCYKIDILELSGNLSYLNNKIFIADEPKTFKNIEEVLFIKE